MGRAGHTRVTLAGRTPSPRIHGPRRLRRQVYPTARFRTPGQRRPGRPGLLRDVRQRVVKPNGRLDVSAISTYATLEIGTITLRPFSSVSVSTLSLAMASVTACSTSAGV